MKVRILSDLSGVKLKGNSCQFLLLLRSAVRVKLAMSLKSTPIESLIEVFKINVRHLKVPISERTNNRKESNRKLNISRKTL